MSDSDLSLFDLFGSQNLLARVTPEKLTEALRGFALDLLPGRDMAWLAMAVRRALATTLPSIEQGPERTSNADIRTSLEQLAALAENTRLALCQCDGAVESRLWWFALSRWDGEGGAEVDGGNSLGEPSEHRRFKAAIAELDWLASFLRAASTATPSQQGPWRQSVARRLRVERAQYLAPIYEAAFGQPVSANNFPTDTRIRAPTPFMDFYCRVVTLAFGEHETTNYTEVVRAACKEHRQHPAEFAEGVVPGL